MIKRDYWRIKGPYVNMFYHFIICDNLYFCDRIAKNFSIVYKKVDEGGG